MNGGFANFLQNSNRKIWNRLHRCVGIAFCRLSLTRRCIIQGLRREIELTQRRQAAKLQSSFDFNVFWQLKSFFDKTTLAPLNFRDFALQYFVFA